MAEPPLRFMNFISEQQLEETKEKRGERVEDGSAQRDRPLFEILKENKDKHQAEFNERLKHRPPKALDDDETEFLEKWEMWDALQIQYIQLTLNLSKKVTGATANGPFVN